MKEIAILFSGILIHCLLPSTYAQSPWKQLSDMPGVRAGHMSCTLNDSIYVFGGVDAIFNTSLNTLYMYDPVQNIWTPKANMQIARASFSAFLADGQIYAIGGAESLFFDAIGSIEKYDPLSDTWTLETEMPRARLGHVAALIEGKIYVIGGAIDHYTLYSEVDVYDLLTKTWTRASDFPTPRMNLSAVVLNGKIYTLGGMIGLTEGEIGKTIVEEYDPATDTWTRKADMTRRRKFTSACVLNDKIYVFGGAQDYCKGVLSSVEEYDPTTDSWKEISLMPSILVLHSVTPLNGKVYISGGASVDCANDVDQTLYEYNPELDLFPFVENYSISNNNLYVKPGIDSVSISVKMRDTLGITLMAEIEIDSMVVDSLSLFDDGGHHDGNTGDSLYSNVWKVNAEEEHNYHVNFKITRIDTDTIVHRIRDLATFTTIGPVEFESFTFVGEDSIPNPGDVIKLDITLRNHGITETATNVRAGLSCDNTTINCNSNLRNFGDINIGESITFLNAFTVVISDECPIETPIPVSINISSNNSVYVYETDTFFITVHEPSYITDIINPEIRIYPNPIDEILNIELNSTENQTIEINIFDITGKKVYQRNFHSFNTNSTEKIDFSGYTEGIYLLKIRMAYSVYVGKVVVR